MDINKIDRKRVLLVGDYKNEKAIASSLIKRGCSVTVINDNSEECERLAEIKGLNVILGDGTRKTVLKDASIEYNDIVIAITDCDEKNLIISEISKEEFKVKRTIALLEDGEKTSFFYKMGVDRVISPLNTVSVIMEEEALKDEVSNRIPINNGRMFISETPVHKGSELSGKKLWELNLPKEIIIGCIMRGDENIVPRGDTTIRDNDILLILSSDQNKLDSFLRTAVK